MKRWETAEPYDPLKHDYITHEDRQWLATNRHAIWVDSSSGVWVLSTRIVALLPEEKDAITNDIVKRLLHESATSPFAEKFIREITKLKVLGRWKP